VTPLDDHGVPTAEVVYLVEYLNPRFGWYPAMGEQGCGSRRLPAAMQRLLYFRAREPKHEYRLAQWARVTTIEESNQHAPMAQKESEP
jgi:hypothetical protein